MWIWMAFAVGAFVLSVVAVMHCGCVFSVTLWVLWAHLAGTPPQNFTGLPVPPWCHFLEFIIIPLSTLWAWAHSSGAGGWVWGVPLRVTVIISLRKKIVST